MDFFHYQNGRLFAEQVDLPDLAATQGTPLYVYSRATLERHWKAFDAALGNHPHLVCYAVKANSNLAVLAVLAKLGSGFDIVSGGELARVLAAGGDPAKVVFSGVGKTIGEMELALEAGIRCFNVESTAELDRLNSVAAAPLRRKLLRPATMVATRELKCFTATCLVLNRLRACNIHAGERIGFDSDG